MRNDICILHNDNIIPYIPSALHPEVFRSITLV